MDKNEGSAVRAASAMHASAHTNAIRYGARGSKEYRRAYGQHVGRFLGAMRQFQRAPAPVAKMFGTSEARDDHGRWAADVQTGRYLAGGTTGLSREQVVAKVRGLLDRASGFRGIGSRLASYSGLIAGKVASAGAGMTGTPPDIADLLDQHVALATGHLIAKAKDDPNVRRLIISALSKGTRVFHKALEPAETSALKDHVARIVADTRLHPRVACDDAALAAVAHGVYRHLHDRLSAQVAAL